jgi:hypothetical protein
MFHKSFTNEPYLSQLKPFHNYTVTPRPILISHLLLPQVSQVVLCLWFPVTIFYATRCLPTPYFRGKRLNWRKKEIYQLPIIKFYFLIIKKMVLNELYRLHHVVYIVFNYLYYGVWMELRWIPKKISTYIPVSWWNIGRPQVRWTD